MSSHKRKLMACYQRLLETEAEKDKLRPARLVTLVADSEWIAAVTARSEAMTEFILAARESCEVWRDQKEQLEQVMPSRQKVA